MSHAPGQTHRPRSLLWRVGAIVWPSFLASGIATTVMFAMIDPRDLHAISFPDWDLSRSAGYSIGFFMFWAVTLCSSFLTWLLLRRRRVLNAEQPVPSAAGRSPGSRTH